MVLAPRPQTICLIGPSHASHRQGDVAAAAPADLPAAAPLRPGEGHRWSVMVVCNNNLIFVINNQNLNYGFGKKKLGKIWGAVMSINYFSLFSVSFS